MVKIKAVRLRQETDRLRVRNRAVVKMDLC